MDAYSSFARRPPVQPAGTDAFDALAAWRSPQPRRFDAQVANDWRGSEPEAAATPSVEMQPIDWDGPVARGLVIACGAILAATLGLMLGGALSL